MFKIIPSKNRDLQEKSTKFFSRFDHFDIVSDNFTRMGMPEHCGLCERIKECEKTDPDLNCYWLKKNRVYFKKFCLVFIFGIFFIFISFIQTSKASEVNIGPEGGEVLSDNGRVKLVIPQGALFETQLIEIATVSNEDLDGTTPTNDCLLSAVECRPHGLVFNTPVFITYHLFQPEIPGTQIELGLYDEVEDVIVPTGQISVVEKDGYTVTFQLEHFSTYAALKPLISEGAPIGSFVKIPLPDMFTGAYSYSVPLVIPPGRKGMQPSFEITYRSSGSNGWLGIGFDINLGYIIRSTRLGPPTYNDTQDTYYFITNAGTTELVHLIDNLYQAKIESSFTKFYKESDDSWRVVAKDGSQAFFGQTEESKEISRKGTFSWYLTKTRDNNGNYLEISYTKDEGRPYLNIIQYTGNENGVFPTNSIEFEWEPREDIFSSYISSSKITTAKRLKEIVINVNGNMVWKYVFDYTYSEDTERSLITAIHQIASDGRELPVQSLSYQKSI